MNRSLGAVLERILRIVATASGSLARFCDHAEHVEDVDRSRIVEAAAQLRAAATELAAVFQLDLREAYARRLAAVENKRYLFALPDGFDGGKQAAEASTWQDLQRIQFHHDRLYHPDVVTLTQAEHLRHCALHAAKITGLLASISPDDCGRSELADRGLADLVVFGLKLPTLVKVRLPDEPLPTQLSDSNSQGSGHRERRPDDLVLQPQ